MNPDRDGKEEPGSEAGAKAPASPSTSHKTRKPKSNIVVLKHARAKHGRPAAPMAIRNISGAQKQEPGTAAPEGPAGPELPSAAVFAAGKALRERLPRHAHGIFKRDRGRVNPLAILQAQDRDRLKQLVPIRYGRMLQTPFTFYRGAAAVMAADLAGTPTTGLRLQACGDCHLLNFGGFATPERNIVFDINDFDETAPAPWEWDVKRLVASFVLAARSQGLRESDGREAAVACARSYRKRLREYSEMSPLEVWYSSISVEQIIAAASPSLRNEFEGRLRERLEKATAASSSDLAYPQLAGMVSGKVRILDAPPLIFHPTDVSDEEWFSRGVSALKCYRDTLSDERRELLDQYRIVDSAMKVVGIGSVGTRCSIMLMMSSNNDPLFLQWKQAKQSVLEPYAGKSAYPHHGQRVVMGQKLMQSASDIFLGWATSNIGVHGYVRQLRDVKIRPLVEAMDSSTLAYYAKMCGWALARSHAKAGNVEQKISGYLGKTENFDEAMGSFAVAYSDQTERDHAALKAAVRAGKIEVHLEE
ncbi:MAG TPA: DUF2252 domain-containing protein [Candidatus Cybelea sp.]|nr:DUF2252 domain-containing protein [Candidatus Cybelea sp.]